MGNLRAGGSLCNPPSPFPACVSWLSPPARAGDDWSSLDEEVQALSAALANQDAGEEAAQLSGCINFLYANSSDVAVVPSGDDLGGFALTEVRLILQGQITGAFSYRLSTDFFGGAAHIFDAYGPVAAGDDLDVVLGQFRSPFLGTALLEENRYLIGHDAKVLFNYRSTDSDAGDEDIFAVGFSLSF